MVKLGNIARFSLPYSSADVIVMVGGNRIESSSVEIMRSVRRSSTLRLTLNNQDLASHFTTQDFLQQLESNGMDVRTEAAGYVLNQSVCFTETAW